MKQSLGFFILCIGILVVISAAGLFIYNLWDENRAASVSASTVEVLHEQIKAEVKQVQTEEVKDISQDEASDIEIDGEKYIGILKIPSLELELPINKDWSYPKLKISPCRYSGDILNSLTIAAHNYKNYFGNISKLKNGDAVILTEVNGYENLYYVEEVIILQATSIEEMVNTEYDLSLFTCTYGGKDRITVRCMRQKESAEIQ